MRPIKVPPLKLFDIKQDKSESDKKDNQVEYSYLLERSYSTGNVIVKTNFKYDNSPSKTVQPSTPQNTPRIN